MGVSIRTYKHIVDDLEVGGTVRVNHDDCPAGSDTRRRLYLTRTVANPEAIVAYCHNCQEVVYYNDGKHQPYRYAKHQTVPKNVLQVTRELIKPPHVDVRIEDWPVEAQAWAYSNKLNAVLCEHYNIGYDPASDRVYLPRHTWVVNHTYGDLQGYQLRNVEHTRNVPKYLTVQQADEKGYTEIAVSSRDYMFKVCVIVEDYVSGIHVAEAHANCDKQVTVLVNYGTKLSYAVMARAAEWDNIAVWLDNDSDHVKNHADRMVRTMRLMKGDGVIRAIMPETDPKHYTYDGIRDTLGAYTWIQ